MLVDGTLSPSFHISMFILVLLPPMPLFNPDFECRGLEADFFYHIIEIGLINIHNSFSIYYLTHENFADSDSVLLILSANPGLLSRGSRTSLVGNESQAVAALDKVVDKVLYEKIFVGHM